MAKFYAAYELDDASREKLMGIFKPKYPEVVAHHITHLYNAQGLDDVPAQPQKVEVVGYHDSGAIQVLAVKIDGRNRQAARDGETGKFYHITFSLDRAQGVSPSKSNAVLQKIADEKGEDALYNLPGPIEISAPAKLLYDTPTRDEAEAEAAAILAQKSRGPNGVIAYAVVNDVKQRPDGTTEPFYNAASQNPLKLAYAFFETDRVGVPVISAPGGTQDIIAHNPMTGESMVVELTKEKNLKEALAAIGGTVPDVKDLDALELHTVATLIEKGWRTTIEDPFTAAVREAREEQGIDLSSKNSYIGAPKQFDRMAITKRTIDRLEGARGEKLFDLHDATTLGEVQLIADGLRQMGPEAMAVQRLFAIQVPGFGTVTPVNSGEQVENKIRGREGKTYSERGRFVTLDEMEQQLAGGIAVAQAEQAQGNDFARKDIVATLERLNIFRRIEAHLVADLKSQGLGVTSSVPPALADTPDSIDQSKKGSASLPDGLKAPARPLASGSGLSPKTP